MDNKTLSTMAFELSVIARNVAETCVKNSTTDFGILQFIMVLEFKKYFRIDRESENNEEGD